MTVASFDIGFVSADDRLVAFYRDVLALDVLEPRRFPDLTVHRLALASGVLKITVPEHTPAPPFDHESFLARVGLRYVTIYVDNLHDVISRWREHGGAVSLGPIEIRAGVETAILIDPDGNTVEAMQGAS